MGGGDVIGVQSAKAMVPRRIGRVRPRLPVTSSAELGYGWAPVAIQRSIACRFSAHRSGLPQGMVPMPGASGPGMWPRMTSR